MAERGTANLADCGARATAATAAAGAARRACMHAQVEFEAAAASSAFPTEKRSEEMQAVLVQTYLADIKTVNGVQMRLSGTVTPLMAAAQAGQTGTCELLVRGRLSAVHRLWALLAINRVRAGECGRG
eukprot:SAG25_NODE_880_length_4970_cov_4.557380_6_plen_128_part_00